MRELKFRVWIPELKRFEYFTMGDFVYPDRYLNQYQHPVQQFTGLTLLDDGDKKIDIYEGDILAETIGSKSEEYEVCFENCAFYARTLDNKSAVPLTALVNPVLVGTLTEREYGK